MYSSLWYMRNTPVIQSTENISNIEWKEGIWLWINSKKELPVNKKKKSVLSGYKKVRHIFIWPSYYYLKHQTLKTIPFYQFLSVEMHHYTSVIIEML